MVAHKVGSFWAALLGCAMAGAPVYSATHNVRDYGARGDGKTSCTEAIQAAIDKCAKGGGGTVLLPPGQWLSGTVYLESNVTLLVESGATLLGSRNRDDYAAPHRRQNAAEDESPLRLWALIAAEGADNIAIRGHGTIDGQGSAFRQKNERRPRGIFLIGCRDVLIEDVHMQGAGSWMQHYRKCERLAIRGISVFNHVTYNNDGLNIDSCRDVHISDCRIDSDDDAIVLKSLSKQPCENVTITNCVVSSHCNSIKMGTESGGGFQNITVSNCAIQSPRSTKRINGRDRGLAGLALEIVDGGEMNRVTISNIAIQGVTAPIFVRLGDRARTYEEGQEKPDVGTLRNVLISNVVATDCSNIGCSITGLPGHPVENITLSNIRLGFDGEGQQEWASKEVPEREGSYPESTMFGELPAWGFYCRHVTGLTLDNIALNTTRPDLRHALVLNDVEGTNIDNLEADYSPGAAPPLRMTSTRSVLIRGCRPKAETDTWLRLEGTRTAGIVLQGNDLSGVRRCVDSAPEVPATAVSLIANRMPGSN